MIHDLCIALCAHRPKSNLLSPYIWPPLPFTTLTPLSSVDCVYFYVLMCLEVAAKRDISLLLFLRYHPISMWAAIKGPTPGMNI